jgi:hypothetical protein
VNASGPNPDDGCAIHGYEPLPETYFRVCGECGHCFTTAEELIDADRKLRDEIAAFEAAHPWPGIEPTPMVYHEDAEDITICPLCTHDF